jgi:hypothetical protein
MWNFTFCNIYLATDTKIVFKFPLLPSNQVWLWTINTFRTPKYLRWEESGTHSLDLYPGGSRFKFRPGDWLSRIKFLVVSFITTAKCGDSTFFGHVHLLPHPIKFITNPVLPLNAIFNELFHAWIPHPKQL